MLRCATCSAEYPQSRPDCIDLFPLRSEGGGHGATDTDWASRQQEMEAWYREMVRTEWSRACFANDYGPFAPVLGGYEGTILDLGGGAGVTRHYLRSDARYVVLDPSVMWLGTEWRTLADQFPCLATPPSFVHGTGEALPFRAGAFDVVLAFWTINHAEDPGRVFQHVARVLRPGGRFLLVLEDMEPQWSDVARPDIRQRGPAAVGRLAARKLAASLPGRSWPLQPDHLRIRESDLRQWSRVGLERSWRAWVGQYLTYEYVARSVR